MANVQCKINLQDAMERILEEAKQRGLDDAGLSNKLNRLVKKAEKDISVYGLDETRVLKDFEVQAGASVRNFSIRKNYIADRRAIFDRMRTAGGLKERLFETQQGMYYRQRIAHTKLNHVEDKAFDDLADAPGADNVKEAATHVKKAKKMWEDMRSTGGRVLRRALLDEVKGVPGQTVYDLELNILLDGAYKGNNPVLTAFARGIQNLRSLVRVTKHALREYDPYLDAAFLKNMPVSPSKAKLKSMGEQTFVHVMSEFGWAKHMHRAKEAAANTEALKARRAAIEAEDTNRPLTQALEKLDVKKKRVSRQLEKARQAQEAGDEKMRKLMQQDTVRTDQAQENIKAGETHLAEMDKHIKAKQDELKAFADRIGKIKVRRTGEEIAADASETEAVNVFREYADEFPDDAEQAIRGHDVVFQKIGSEEDDAVVQGTVFTLGRKPKPNVASYEPGLVRTEPIFRGDDATRTAAFHKAQLDKLSPEVREKWERVARGLPPDTTLGPVKKTRGKGKTTEDKINWDEVEGAIRNSKAMRKDSAKHIREAKKIVRELDSLRRQKGIAVSKQKALYKRIAAARLKRHKGIEVTRKRILADATRQGDYILRLEKELADEVKAGALDKADANSIAKAETQNARLAEIDRKIKENDVESPVYLAKLYKEMSQDAAAQPSYRGLDNTKQDYWFDLNTEEGQSAYREFTKNMSRENSSPIMDWRQSVQQIGKDASMRSVLGDDMHKVMAELNEEFTQANGRLRDHTQRMSEEDLDAIFTANTEHLKVMDNPLDVAAHQITQSSKRVVSAGFTTKSGWRQITSDFLGHSISGAWAQGRGGDAYLEMAGNLQRLLRLSNPESYKAMKRELAARGQETQISAIAQNMGHLEAFEEAGQVLTGKKNWGGNASDWLDVLTRKYADFVNFIKGDDFVYTAETVVARHITGRNLMELVEGGWESGHKVYRRGLADMGMTKEAITALKGAKMRKSDLLDQTNFWNKFSGNRTDKYMITSFDPEDLPNLAKSGFVRKNETVSEAASRLKGLHDHFLEHASDRYVMRSTPLDTVGRAKESNAAIHFVKAHSFQFWTPALTQIKHRQHNIQRWIGLEAGSMTWNRPVEAAKKLFHPRNALPLGQYAAYMGTIGMLQQWGYDILAGKQPRDITVANVLNGMFGASVGGLPGFLISGTGVLYDLSFMAGLGGGDTTEFYTDLIQKGVKGEWGQVFKQLGGGVLDHWAVGLVVPNSVRDAMGMGPKEIGRWRQRYLEEISGVGEGFEEGTPEEAKSIMPSLFPDIREALDGQGFDFWRKHAGHEYWKKQQRAKDRAAKENK